MSDPTYTTRDQASAPPLQLVRAMARAHYEASRLHGSSRPPFEETNSSWQTEMLRDMTAALTAAKNAGWRIERG